MLFKLAPGEDFFELNPGAKIIPEFRERSARQMFAIALVADIDHDNPLRTLPDKQKRERAAELAGYPRESDGKRLDKNGRDFVAGNVDSVEKAIAKYAELQYDEDDASLSAINRQIQEARELMSVDKIACATEIKEVTSEGGEKKKITIIDMKLAMSLANDAIKLGKSLDELLEARDKIADRIKSKKPAVNLITYTASDVIPDLGDSDEEISTVALFMEKKRQQNG